MVVVTMVVNRVCSPPWSALSEVTAFPSVGDASFDVSFCDTSLQMTSEVLVPRTFSPNLHLQRMKGDQG